MSNSTSLRNMANRPTPAQRRVAMLAERDERAARLASQWRGHMRDLFHPFTLPDGSYWRGGRWNSPTRTK